MSRTPYPFDVVTPGGNQGRIYYYYSDAQTDANTTITTIFEYHSHIPINGSAFSVFDAARFFENCHGHTFNFYNPKWWGDGADVETTLNEDGWNLLDQTNLSATSWGSVPIVSWRDEAHSGEVYSYFSDWSVARIRNVKGSLNYGPMVDHLSTVRALMLTYGFSNVVDYYSK